ncbi:hypothetical protein AN477_05680 [Alicyclobacillus ferrooxydans]|uniref:Uncharacterized protein n=1 Tax=Alicyclobacillus ferrooxydans TaxID=471514 RepID=A0A0P9F0B7_9BACL|nr:hypothetical protein AN477_05680 [Alicyclobacillus ferrooxydans]
MSSLKRGIFPENETMKFLDEQKDCTREKMFVHSSVVNWRKKTEVKKFVKEGELPGTRQKSGHRGRFRS